MWALFISGTTVGHSAALRIEPVLVEVFAPGAASTLTLRNDDNAEINVQIRVFKWSQVNGQETLEPTTDVVASPPAIKLAPRTEYVARIVRTSKQPIQAEESYRLFVDQLPQIQGRGPRQINVLLRQSIPVFFSPRVGANANVTWSFGYDGSRLLVTAQNSGERRLRISSLTLHDGTGRTISFGNGLVGYVLNRSAMSWTAPAPAHGFGAGGAINLSAQTDTGPINVVVPLPVRR
jgi:fimbrial chaperone protein